MVSGRCLSTTGAMEGRPPSHGSLYDIENPTWLNVLHLPVAVTWGRVFFTPDSDSLVFEFVHTHRERGKHFLKIWKESCGSRTYPFTMAKSSRASSVKANNQRLKKNVFGPVEDARTARLSAKLLELAAQPKPQKDTEMEEISDDAEAEKKAKPAKATEGESLTL